MALTLLEAAKQNSGDVVRSSVIEMFAESNDLLAALPFRTIAGNAYKYNQEGTLPAVAFRSVNASYTEAVGVINPQVESLVIAGGDLDVDKFITATQGAGVRATHVAMKVKSLAHEIGHKFIKGDSTSTDYECDGLQVRLTGNQLVANGASSGGDALTLAKLDEAIDAVDDPTHLLMSKAMRRRLSQAARAGLDARITTGQDAFGRKITEFDGLPILIADRNSDKNSSLAFDEANPGGGSSVGTSIYTLSIGDGMLQGIQNGVMDVRDLGELQSGTPADRTRVEWYVSLLVEHGRAASRLYGITDAAVTA